MSEKKIYLLREYQELCPNGYCEDLLTEIEKKLIAEQDVLFLTGIMQVSDTVNGNGRIYRKETLMKEFKNYQTLIDNRSATGELDHPDSSIISLKNVSHVVVQQWWDDNKWMGKIKVLNTPSGQIVKSLIEGGVRLGISSRALGSVTEDIGGKRIVGDNLSMIAFDIVPDPSSPGAWLNLMEVNQKDYEVFLETRVKPFVSAEKLSRINELAKRVIK